MKDQKIFTIRLCILGSLEVGKTSLCSQFVSHYFTHDYNKTSALNIFRSLILLNNTPVMLEIDDLFAINHPSLSQSSDSTNKQTFQKIIENKTSKPTNNQVPSIYSEKKIDGLIFVFDLSSNESFILVEQVIKQVASKEEERVGLRHPKITKKVLVGNKADLSKQSVKQSEIERLKLSYSMEYFRTSAKNMKSVDSVFRFISTTIFDEKYSKVHIDTSVDSNLAKPETSTGLLAWCDCSKRSKNRAACSIQ